MLRPIRVHVDARNDEQRWYKMNRVLHRMLFSDENMFWLYFQADLARAGRECEPRSGWPEVRTDEGLRSVGQVTWAENESSMKNRTLSVFAKKNDPESKPAYEYCYCYLWYVSLIFKWSLSLWKPKMYMCWNVNIVINIWTMDVLYGNFGCIICEPYMWTLDVLCEHW